MSRAVAAAVAAIAISREPCTRPCFLVPKYYGAHSAGRRNLGREEEDGCSTAREKPQEINERKGERYQSFCSGVVCSLSFFAVLEGTSLLQKEGALYERNAYLSYFQNLPLHRQ